jgi:hypothetical protein
MEALGRRSLRVTFCMAPQSKTQYGIEFMLQKNAMLFMLQA